MLHIDLPTRAEIERLVAPRGAPAVWTVSFAEAAGAGSYGMVDEIARRALASGARVLAARRADIPGGGVLAAILRYPV